MMMTELRIGLWQEKIISLSKQQSIEVVYNFRLANKFSLPETKQIDETPL
jgi:hypothetical protein